MRNSVTAISLAIVACLAVVGSGSELRAGIAAAAPTALQAPAAGWFQVRVQQRVMIRLPRSSAPTGSVSAGKAPEARNMKEKKIGKCLWMKELAAARPGEGKQQHLEFLTRKGQIIRGYLGKGCLAREFYAGTYMERAKDGKLCVERDMLHARTGAKCEIDKFRELVPS